MPLKQTVLFTTTTVPDLLAKGGAFFIETPPNRASSLPIQYYVDGEERYFLARADIDEMDKKVKAGVTHFEKVELTATLQADGSVAFNGSIGQESVVYGVAPPSSGTVALTVKYTATLPSGLVQLISSFKLTATNGTSFSDPQGFEATAESLGTTQLTFGEESELPDIQVGTLAAGSIGYTGLAAAQQPTIKFLPGKVTAQTRSELYIGYQFVL